MLRPPKDSDIAPSSRWDTKRVENKDEGAERSILPEQPSDTQESNLMNTNENAGQIESLSLGPDRTAINPLKRERATGSELPDAIDDHPSTVQPVHQAELSSVDHPGGADPEFHPREVAKGEDSGRSSAVKPKLFDPERDNPNTKVGSQRGKIRGHRHNISKDSNVKARRRASSDSGDRQSRPQPSDRNPVGPKPLQPGQATILKPPGRSDNNLPRNETPEPEMPDDVQDDPEPSTEMLRQPETRPISHDQLVVEVKGIYAGLVMVEAKCIDVDEKQSILAQEDPSRRDPLKNDQWQSLIALHKQLLHEHHDFFLASQHPSASSNLSKLAAKYSMPARMWRHGIHAFLEVLRHRLPESLEHMLAFIYIAYSMMALLYETVSTFEDTWIECLGDLGRYRMAIEDDEPKDREVWSGVARFWYSKAADKNPTVGRLYHHLAILARPYTLEQLSFYTRSLTCVTPFESARGSIMTLFNPILNGRETGHHRSSSMEPLTIKAHGLLFLFPKRSTKELDDVVAELKDNDGAIIDECIEKTGVRFKRIGVYLAVSNLAALFEFGALTPRGTHRSRLRLAFDQRNTTVSVSQPISTDTKPEDLKSVLQPTSLLTDEEIETSTVVLSYAADITFSMFKTVLGKTHWERNYVLPMVHVKLVFLWCISSIPDAIELLGEAIPWEDICSYLNHFKIEESWRDTIWNGATFPSTAGTSGRPPPEHYIIRGQVYTQGFFPKTWFVDAKVDDEERMVEQSSHDAYRTIIVLWLAARICSLNRWINFDKNTQSFVTVGSTKGDGTTTTQASEASPKVEKLDENEMMEDIPAKVPNNQDTTSDIPYEKTANRSSDNLPDAMDDDPPYRSSTTTRTNTERTDKTNITAATTVHQEAPGTPRALGLDEDEPEDTPMMDISPGKEHTSLASITPIKADDSSWLANPVIDPGSSPLQKNKAGFVPDPNSVRILQPDENPEENEP